MRVLFKESYGKGVELERITALQAMDQAEKVVPLIEAEREWLAAIQPDTVHNYRDRFNAIRHITRAAPPGTPTELNTYIVHHRDTVKGMATVALNQQVIHPEEGAVEGTALDYWLAMEADEDLHRGVAQNLAVICSSRGWLRGPKLFAVVPEETVNPPIGFSHELDPIGEPAVLTTPGTEDPYHIVPQARTAQLYGLNQDLT